MNVSSIKTPGVYINEIDAFPPSVAQVATAIPAFVGYTEKTPEPILKPVRIKSMLEFEQFFGGAPEPEDVQVYLDDNNLATNLSTVTESKFKLYNSMRLFYANGGGVCYIVSVNTYADAIAVGDFQSGLAELRKEDEPTLLLFPDAINLTATQLGALQQAALLQCGYLMDRFAILDVLDDDFSEFRTQVGNQNLKYGAAYYPNLSCNQVFRYFFKTMNGDGTGGTIDFKTKFPALVAEIDALIVLETDTEEYQIAEAALIQKIPFYSSILNRLSQLSFPLPPSGILAGIYAQTDATRGVWKSPANVSINGIIGLTDDITDADQEDMNIHETGKSINAIRKFTGKGFLVWGGRTLAGNSSDWKYINVRRLANMIEESVKKACMQFVFEPNVAQTWISVKGMIENYLSTLWNDGALAGAKPEHAFFVQIGLNTTMTAQDILDGKMIVKIGYAPSRPAEFIILEFKQMQQRS